jgi:uncharacterized protein (DUF302 family)
MRKLMLIAWLMFGFANHACAEGLITAKSGVPVSATLDRLQKLVSADGFVIVARVPHSEAAKAAGLTLRPTELLLFGRPQGGTPIMVCNQRAGIDLPLRALAWQDEAGQVWLGMVDPQVLKQRYGLGAECDGALKAMDAAVRKYLTAATLP